MGSPAPSPIPFSTHLRQPARERRREKIQSLVDRPGGISLNSLVEDFGWLLTPAMLQVLVYIKARTVGRSEYHGGPCRAFAFCKSVMERETGMAPRTVTHVCGELVYLRLIECETPGGPRKGSSTNRWGLHRSLLLVGTGRVLTGELLDKEAVQAANIERSGDLFPEGGISTTVAEPVHDLGNGAVEKVGNKTEAAEEGQTVAEVFHNPCPHCQGSGKVPRDAKSREPRAPAHSSKTEKPTADVVHSSGFSEVRAMDEGEGQKADELKGESQTPESQKANPVLERPQLDPEKESGPADRAADRYLAQFTARLPLGKLIEAKGNPHFVNEARNVEYLGEFIPRLGHGPVNFAIALLRTLMREMHKKHDHPGLMPAGCSCHGKPWEVHPDLDLTRRLLMCGEEWMRTNAGGAAFPGDPEFPAERIRRAFEKLGKVRSPGVFIVHLNKELLAVSKEETEKRSARQYYRPGAQPEGSVVSLPRAYRAAAGGDEGR